MVSSQEKAEYLEFAAMLARSGGDLASAGRKAGQLRDGDHIHCKETKLDLVTDLDRQAEDLITGRIRQRYPDHGIYGEERGRRNETSPFCWIIDPIDGTASFVHDQPTYSCSVALHVDGRPLVGAVYMPEFGELFTASLGGGAFCNGRAIHVSRRSELSESILHTGFACLRAGWTEINNLKYFCAFSPLVQGIRRFGSAAMDLCYVACGRCEAFWELNLKPYDYAAGMLIVTEAGGRITDLRGGEQWETQGLLATNGLMHPVMMPFFDGYRRPDGR